MRSILQSLAIGSLASLCSFNLSFATPLKQTQGNIVLNPGVASSCSFTLYNVSEQGDKIIQNNNACYGSLPCDVFQDGGYQINYASNSSACPGNIDKIVIKMTTAQGDLTWILDASASALSAQTANSDDVSICNGHFYPPASQNGSVKFVNQSNTDSRGHICSVSVQY